MYHLMVRSSLNITVTKDNPDPDDEREAPSMWSRVLRFDNRDDGTDEGRFLQAVPDSSCSWFVATLGPDYNTLHADNFHLQALDGGACR